MEAGFEIQSTKYKTCFQLKCSYALSRHKGGTSDGKSGSVFSWKARCPLESPDHPILDLKDRNFLIFVPEEVDCFRMTGKIKNLVGLRQFDNGPNRLFAPTRVEIDKDLVHHDGKRFGPLGKFPDEAEAERKIELLNGSPA